MTNRQKTVALFVGFGIIFTAMLFLKPDYQTREQLATQVPKATNLKDYYLIYKLYFDEEWRSVNEQ